MVRVNRFQGELAGINRGIHVLFEWDDKFDSLLVDGKEHFAIKEPPVDNQRTDGAPGADIFLVLFQNGKNMQIVGFFYGVDFNCQGDAGIEFVNGPDLPTINGDLHGFELTIFPVAPRLHFAFARYRATTFELLSGSKSVASQAAWIYLGKRFKPANC